MCQHPLPFPLPKRTILFPLLIFDLYVPFKDTPATSCERAHHASIDWYTLCNKNCIKVVAALLIDATNAFNCLNREAALHNIRHLCPSLSTILINTYRNPTELFVDGSTILSQEGTTQGDPLAMPMYALGILPLIQRSSVDVNQVWYVDDAAATGTVLNLKECSWWSDLSG